MHDDPPDYSSAGTMDIWVPVVAAAVGATASLIGVAASHVLQRMRDRKADEGDLRDRKPTGSATDTPASSHAARAMRWAVGELTVLWEGETSEGRNARLDAALRKNLEGMDEAVTRLMLEREAADVLAAMDKVIKTFNEFRIGLWRNQQQPGSVNLADVQTRLSESLDLCPCGSAEAARALERPT